MDMEEDPTIYLYYIHIGRVEVELTGVKYANRPSVVADPLTSETWCSLLLLTLHSELMGDHMTCNDIIAFPTLERGLVCCEHVNGE